MKPLLLTLGEPAGIGADCVIRAWQAQPQQFDDVIVVAPLLWLQQRAALLHIDVCFQEIGCLQDARQASVLSCWNPLNNDFVVSPVQMGKTSVVTAQAVIACIEHAVEACLRGEAAALVTAPIEKAVLRQAGFEFPGHTEFLAYLSARHIGQACDMVMMLASPVLRVALLTTHLALRDVADALSIKQTLRCLQIVHADLTTRFAIAKPRLAMCGLNPHAGEQGHFGDEEIRLLSPAVQQARAMGIDVTLPQPADSLFAAQQRQNFDAIVCCYHDQALIPLKALSFGDAINITLGLPFIRTSVDHGTALDRAGSDQVSYTSLMEAIKQARHMSQQQVAHES